MCKPKLVSVSIELFKEMAELIGDIDEAQSKCLPMIEIRKLVEELHKKNMEMLGAHVNIVYMPDDQIPIFLEEVFQTLNIGRPQ
jgi:hypothetical protein